MIHSEFKSTIVHLKFEQPIFYRLFPYYLAVERRPESQRYHYQRHRNTDAFRFILFATFWFLSFTSLHFSVPLIFLLSWYFLCHLFIFLFASLFFILLLLVLLFFSFFFSYFSSFFSFFYFSFRQSLFIKACVKSTQNVTLEWCYIVCLKKNPRRTKQILRRYTTGSECVFLVVLFLLRLSLED